jgi:hypothetical protein
MPRMSQHQPTALVSRLTPALLWLAMACAGCQSSNVDSTTGLRIAAAWSGQIDQLEYAVMTASGAIHAPERRPSVAQGPLTSDADVVIYLPDQMGGQHVRCLVAGYYQGARMMDAEGQADVVAGQVVDVRVTLALAGAGPDGGAGAGGGGGTGGMGGAGGMGGGGGIGGAGGSAGGKNNGQACSGASQCASGFCVDGVCCAGACAGACQACNVPGKEGTCSPVADGTRETMCAQEAVKTCGLDGTCDGAGACRKYPAGTVCIPGACSGNTVTGAGSCDGKGTCQTGTSVSCGAYACAGGTCKTACTSNGDCVSPSTCAGGKCGLWKPLGQACGAGAECASGQCVDGVCCSTPSCGPCFTCNLPGAAGSCKPVLAGAPEPHGLCTVQPVSTCGLNGTCNGNGACASYPNGTLCRQARTCLNGVCR